MLLILLQVEETGFLKLFPPWASELITLLALGLTAFVIWRSRTSKFWKDERDAAVTQNDRLRKENEELNKSLTELRAKTDLNGLREETRTQHNALILAIQELAHSEAEARVELFQAVQGNTKALLGFQSQVASTFESQQTAFAAISRTLENLLARAHYDETQKS